MSNEQAWSSTATPLPDRQRAWPFLCSARPFSATSSGHLVTEAPTVFGRAPHRAPRGLAESRPRCARRTQVLSPRLRTQ